MAAPADLQGVIFGDLQRESIELMPNHNDFDSQRRPRAK